MLKAFNPLDEPVVTPLSPYVNTFNISFQQIYEMFSKVLKKLTKEPQSFDQTSIPNIVNVVNEIRRIRSSFSDDDWDEVRIQRNFMAHEYPHNPVLWEFA